MKKDQPAVFVIAVARQYLGLVKAPVESKPPQVSQNTKPLSSLVRIK